jgi:hypothetical protein
MRIRKPFRRWIWSEKRPELKGIIIRSTSCLYTPHRRHKRNGKCVYA